MNLTKIFVSRYTFFLWISLFFMASNRLLAQDDSVRNGKLQSVRVQSKASNGLSSLSGAENGVIIGQGELFKAACCNLGESFLTNPSVDVNYSDAAIGAKQIKLLGLNGEYVQLLTEGLPFLGRAAIPYRLGYIPGSWMKSISVSKGTSSVKFGYQGITGQINVEYLKPEEPEGVSVNLYGDSRLKFESNVVATKHIGNYLSTEILAHAEKDFAHHDDDGDGWHDSPTISQFNVQNRWKYHRKQYIFHAGFGLLSEEREGGQLEHFATNPFRISLNSNKFDAYMKHAYVFNHTHNTNLAFIGNANIYNLDGTFGDRLYGFDEHAFSGRLLFEHDFNHTHNISMGYSIDLEKTSDELRYLDRVRPVVWIDDSENLLHRSFFTHGWYGQYTFKPNHKFTAMLGLRFDNMNNNHWYVTPRVHLKWMPKNWVTLRASAGKGYRNSLPLAEYHWLLSSGRQLFIHRSIPPEEAWNCGFSSAWYFPIKSKPLKINLEYYYTHFLHQTVVDLDSHPNQIHIDDLDGTSFSHTLQVDASYPFTKQWETTVAFRLNDVRCTYGTLLLQKPLSSRYKGLLTISWKPRMGLWNLDLTLQLNGGGRMPTPYLLADGSPSWDDTFPAYPQLNFQVSRLFKHFSLYLGGENLTGYKQKNAVIAASNPWSPDFDPTLVWGPVHGLMVYFGLRMNLFGKE